MTYPASQPPSKIFCRANAAQPTPLETSRKSLKAPSDLDITVMNTVASITEDVFTLSKVFSLTAYSIIGLRSYFGISHDLHRFYEKLQMTRILITTFLIFKQISYFFSSDYKKDCQERKHANVTENGGALILAISDIFHILTEVNLSIFTKIGAGANVGLTVMIGVCCMKFSTGAIQEFSKINDSLEKKYYIRSKILKAAWFVTEYAERIFFLLGKTKEAALSLKVITACLGIQSALLDKSLAQYREKDIVKLQNQETLKKLKLYRNNTRMKQT